ncbi:MAG: Rieske 2Fe-2S domain-containing protein, partial [Stellaceae bacterium]
CGRYLRRFWHPVYRSADLAPGRSMRVKIMNEYFTLYRGEGGRAHLLVDRCPHRQTSLVHGWVEGDRIRCFYHGWLYDGSGQCVEQPAEKASFAAKVRVPNYPVEEYMGLIFAYLGTVEPPPFPRYPELEDANSDVAVNRHPVPCNYFQRIENDLDETHVHFVHRVSTKSYGLDEIPEIVVSETPYGIRREGHRKCRGANITRVGHFLWPNISLIDLPPSPEHAYWTVQIAWRVPRDDESMITYSLRLMKPTDAGVTRRFVAAREAEPSPLQISEDILAGRRRIQDIDPNYPALFVVEDNVALAAQGRITDRAQDWLGQSDKGIILLRRILERELTALAEGRPLKEWRRPKERMGLAVSEVTGLEAF